MDMVRPSRAARSPTVIGPSRSCSRAATCRGPSSTAAGGVALRIAERSGADLASSNARLTLGIALVHRDTAAERDLLNCQAVENWDSRQAFDRGLSFPYTGLIAVDQQFPHQEARHSRTPAARSS